MTKTMGVSYIEAPVKEKVTEVAMGLSAVDFFLYLVLVYPRSLWQSLLRFFLPVITKFNIRI